MVSYTSIESVIRKSINIIIQDILTQKTAIISKLEAKTEDEDIFGNPKFWHGLQNR